MRIAMIGTGYVGLVSGACFAEFGLEVVGVDKDAGKIEMLEEGKIPIYEPGLDALVEKHTSRRPAHLHHRPRGRDRGCRGRVHRGRHAVAARRRPCRPVLRLRRRGGDRGHAQAPDPGRHQVHGPGRHRPEAAEDLRAPASRARHRHRVQPRVPARGLGDRGLPAPRPRRLRRRERACQGGARPLLPAA